MNFSHHAGAASLLTLIFLGAGCAESKPMVPAPPQESVAVPSPTPLETGTGNEVTAIVPAPKPAKIVVPTPSLVPSGTSTRTLLFKSMGDSKASGSAVFVKTTDGLKVTISIKNTASGSVHSANIESGTCAGRGSVMYPLKDLIKGYSISLLADLGFNNIFTPDKVMSIKVKPSNGSSYVACADIR